MHRLVVLLGLASLMMLPACQSGMMRQDSEPVAQEQAATQEEVISQQEQAATPEVVTREEYPVQQEEALTQQEQTVTSEEFYGQAPKFDSVAEKVVLEAKNGNVTLTHRDHAKMMDCKTCHEGTPGKMPQFNKDKAHALCTGCHKEKGAGPTKCTECHKK